MVKFKSLTSERSVVERGKFYPLLLFSLLSLLLLLLLLLSLCRRRCYGGGNGGGVSGGSGGLGGGCVVVVVVVAAAAVIVVMEAVLVVWCGGVGSDDDSDGGGGDCFLKLLHFSLQVIRYEGAVLMNEVFKKSNRGNGSRLGRKSFVSMYDVNLQGRTSGAVTSRNSWCEGAFEVDM
jgi:hypothetical protein